MNRPDRWLWRLRSLWWATAAGFGWHRRAAMRLAYRPRKPWWRRLFSGPSPPPPDFHQPAIPPWAGPPEDEIGVAVPLRVVLASDGVVLIALIDCVAYSVGFEFRLAVRAREELDLRTMGFDFPQPPGSPQRDDLLRIGIEFADGRAASDTGGPAEAGVTAHLQAAAEGREPELPEGPLLGSMGGGGGGKRWDFHYWAWPLPPPGRLTITSEWPARGMALSAHEVDAGEILRAAALSTKLWTIGKGGP